MSLFFFMFFLFLSSFSFVLFLFVPLSITSSKERATEKARNQAVDFSNLVTPEKKNSHFFPQKPVKKNKKNSKTAQ